MRIEIRGVQFVNKGAELMLYAVLQQIEEHLPQAEIVLEPGVNSSYRQRALLGALQKFNLRKGKWDLNRWSYNIPRKLRHWLMRQFGIVTEADIDVVLDASGFAYGDQWGSVKFKHLGQELQRLAAHGKKFVFLPQALGPFSRAEDINVVRDAFPAASLICAREETSFQHVRDILPDADNLEQFPDFTNLVAAITPEAWQSRENTLLLIPNYNMVSSRNQNKGWNERYVTMMVEAIQIGRDMGLVPVVLNHEGEADEAICQKIVEQAGGDIEIIREPHPLKVKGIIGASSLVVCSRFHGCVSALCQARPCLGTSWSHKYERLFEEYQQADNLLTPELTADDLKQKMQGAVVISEASDSAREALKQRSGAMWTRVFSVLD